MTGNLLFYFSFCRVIIIETLIEIKEHFNLLMLLIN